MLRVSSALGLGYGWTKENKGEVGKEQGGKGGKYAWVERWKGKKGYKRWRERREGIVDQREH